MPESIHVPPPPQPGLAVTHEQFDKLVQQVNALTTMMQGA